MFGTPKMMLQLFIFVTVQSLLLPANAFPSDDVSEANSKENDIVNTPQFKITLYPWNNHIGRPAILVWSEEELKELTCKEVPSQLQRKVRSLNTHDKCVVLFSGRKCDGAQKTVKKGSPSHNRLSDICFQRRPLSARPCKDEENLASNEDHV